jgi:hypothetical protein
MSTVLSTTAQQIIDDAYTLIKVKSFLDPLENEQVEFALRMLNSMIKQWEVDGVHLNTISNTTITLYGSKQSYTLGPGSAVYDIETGRPVRLISANRRGTDDVDTPVNRIALEDYRRIPEKAAVGEVSSVAYHRNTLYGTIFVWPVNDEATAIVSTRELVCTFERPFDIFDSNEDTPDLPADMNLALTYGLASILVNITPLSAAEKQMIKAEAIAFYTRMKGNEQESIPFFFKPDVRR